MIRETKKVIEFEIEQSEIETQLFFLGKEVEKKFELAPKDHNLIQVELRRGILLLRYKRKEP